MQESIAIPVTGEDMTKYYEGYKDKIYMDTKGNPTIGYGFNLANEDIRASLSKDVTSGRRSSPREWGCFL